MLRVPLQPAALIACYPGNSSLVTPETARGAPILHDAPHRSRRSGARPREATMTINVTGQLFTGTHTADNFGPGFGDDVYKMTADNNVTDTINGGKGSDTVDYSASSIGVTITLTDPT